MLETTIGQLMVNEALPKAYRDYTRVLDGAGVEQLFQKVAEDHRDDPDVYADVAKKLSDVGRNAAYRTAGFSFSLQHLRRPPHIQRQLDELSQKIDQIYENEEEDDNPEKQGRLLQLLEAAREPLEKEIYDDAKRTNNPLAFQIMSKARGNPTNLRSLLGADLMYLDPDGSPVPIPILSSISQGLTPAEYMASTYGARKSTIDTKLATADAGYFGKKLTQAAHRLVVTDTDDADDPGDRIRGLPVDVMDSGNIGGLLAHDLGGYKRNTILTAGIMKDLSNKGHDQLLIRSPLVGGPEDGGVYSRDVGIREKGGLPSLGEFVGIAAAQSVSEKVSQGSLNCLAAGTLVRMADWTTKAIEDIVIGDVVMGADTQGNTFPVAVVRTFDNGERECQRTLFQDMSRPQNQLELRSTADHKLLVTCYRLTAQRSLVLEHCILPVGVSEAAILARLPRDLRLCTSIGTQSLAALHRVSQEVLGRLPTYDIEVDHPDHLFVLANGLIVSNSKHAGGVAGAAANKAVGGFALLDQMTQVPKSFKGGAAHSQLDGTVSKIEEAPHGGQYVYVGSQKHYVPHGYALTVKPGDEIEAGDVLSEGLPNPAQVVQHKGIGEGSRYYTMAFMKAMQSAGFKPERRNIELVTRGLINHVALDEEMGDYVPGDVVPYHTLERQWTPRPDMSLQNITSAVGKYLEQPVLHYSIGTKIQPSMLPLLKKFNVAQLPVHKDPPPFRPVMIPARENLAYDPDPYTRMLGSGLKKSVLQAAHRGGVADAGGTSYVPAIISGNAFGTIGKTAPASRQTPPSGTL